MCGIGGILRVIKPGDPDYPTDADSPLRAASGEWVWHGPPVPPREAPRGEDASGGAGGGAGAWLIPDAWLDVLDEGIMWRGPDGAGRFRDRVVRPDGTIVEVALVHRRLSIIDHEGGGQPMVVRGCDKCTEIALEVMRRLDVTGNCVQTDDLQAIVFNGCIYNHHALRNDLQRAGHRCESSHSDTEALLHSERELELSSWDLREIQNGIRVLPEGMMSYARWDRSLSILSMGSDGCREKPLYSWYDPSRGFVVCASTAGAVDFLRRTILDLPSATPLTTSEHKQIREQIAEAVAEYLHLGFNSSGLPLPSVRTGGEEIAWDHLYPVQPVTIRGRAAGCAGGVIGILIVATVMAAFIAAGRFLLSLIPATALALTALKLYLTESTRRSIRDRPGIKHRQRKEDSVENALRESVLGRLDADVPLGCFLSGGIDSSLIASFAAEALGAELETFSMRMPDPAYDESPYAEEVATLLGSRHTTFECDPTDAAGDLLHLISMYGLPFGDSSVLPTYWLCRGAREHVKAALSGDGGDELFFGYQRHLAARYLNLWSKPFVAMLPTEALDLHNPKSRDSKKHRMIMAARHTGYGDLVAVFPTPDLQSLIGRQGKRTARSLRIMSGWRGFDFKIYLEGDLLRKTDLASMAVGLEVRLPFLGPDVIEAAASISPRHHMSGGTTKAILRDMARRRGLPPSITDRPKQGFAIPISDWFRSDFGGLRTLLLDMLAGEKPFGRVHDVLDINMGFVRRMLDEHWAAGGLMPMHTTRHVRPRDHGQRLFALLSLAIWARTLDRSSQR